VLGSRYADVLVGDGARTTWQVSKATTGFAVWAEEIFSTEAQGRTSPTEDPDATSA
jgi:hypothetical protein